MATKGQKADEAQVPAPAETNANLPSTDLASKYASYGGAGVSSNADDTKVPMIAVLQPLSPQVDQGNAKYIAGAKAGDILLKGLEPPIVDGSAGIIFQMAAFQKAIVEWVPRNQGGGFVRRIDVPLDDVFERYMPEEAQQVRNQQSGRMQWKMPNGNDLIETRYHIGNVVIDDLLMPFVIPFTSTGHDVSRTWQQMLNATRFPDGRPKPAFLRLFNLTTVRKQNAAGTWYQFSVASAGLATEAQADRGAQLYDALQQGIVKVADDEREGAGGGQAKPDAF